MQVWSGLQALQEVVERLRRRLRVFRDARGVELFDLPRAPRPDPETPAPPRFLPDYDNVFLSHADRARIVHEEIRRQNRTGVQMRVAPFLLDGFLRGTWRIARQRSGATLEIAPFERLSKRDAAALGSEGVRLLEFAAPADKHEVRFTAAPA
jgi:hypothetical protein